MALFPGDLNYFFVFQRSIVGWRGSVVFHQRVRRGLLKCYYDDVSARKLLFTEYIQLEELI